MLDDIGDGLGCFFGLPALLLDLLGLLLELLFEAAFWIWPFGDRDRRRQRIRTRRERRKERSVDRRERWREKRRARRDRRDR